MISELDESIRQLFVKVGGFDPAEIDVSFDIPNREWSTGISKPTLNCYLFDIRENLELKQHGMQTERQGQHGAVRRRPRLYFDLTYVVTAWTRAVEDEHRLLWHALRTLLRFSTLPVEHLQGELRELDVPIYARTAQSNGVLKSPGEFWTALENQIKPSLAYLITLAFDRDALPTGPPVFTTTIRVRQDTAPPEKAEEMIWFAGTVRDDAGEPVAGATVEIEGHALQALSDREGRYRLRIPAPGHYTLVARRNGTRQRHEVDIPAVTYDINLQA